MEGACARGKEIANEVNNVLAQIGRKRAGGGEHDTDAFFQEEEAGGCVVLQDDVWVASAPLASGKKRPQSY